MAPRAAACLERPYTGDSLPSLAYRIVTDLSQNAMRDFSSSAAKFGYSRDLCAAIEDMLHKRPKQRATLSELLSREVRTDALRVERAQATLDALRPSSARNVSDLRDARRSAPRYS